MTEFFLTVVNMSISASWIVLAVLLLRLVLKKAPKWIIVLLWGIVAIRLICPFSIESALSLIPSAETINPEIALNPVEIDSGVAIIDNVVNPIIDDATITFQPEKDLNIFRFIMPYLAGIWLAGIAVLFIYTAISYAQLRKKVCTAVLLQDNIFQSENVVSPFVLGIFKPRIYLPFHLSTQDMAHVIAHEQAHIQRKDHWWKPFGFLLLSIHWFNPLMWLGYILLCRDIELACDEKVIKQMDTEQKADYSQALLTCSVNRRIIAACPLAFGEVSVKQRVKSVLNYKKPAFWIIIIAIIATVVVGVCFLTNPPSTALSSEMSAFIEEQILEHHRGGYKSGEFSCADFEVLGTKKEDNCTTVYMWVLYEEYTDDNGKIEDISGGHIPTAITLRKSNGQYELVEYWEPRDGDRYVKDIRDKFPFHLWQKATDSQRYIKKQQAACNEKATKYFASTSNVGGVDGPENVTILETTVSSTNWSDKSTIYMAALNRDKMHISSVPHLPIYKFDTLQELDQFKETHGTYHTMDRVYDTIPSFNDSTAQYNSAFFEENSLILVYVEAGSGSLQFGVRNVIYNGNSLCVYIEETSKSVVGTANMAGWFITLAVTDKQIENCTEFDAVFYQESDEHLPEDEESVTESVSQPTCLLVYAETPLDEIDSLSEKEEFIYTHNHYQIADGMWHSEGYDYKYRLELTGRMNNAAKNTTYIVLCNESITFDQAWKAFGFSSNTEDYFDPEDALIVGYRNFSGSIEEPAESNPPVATPDNDQNSNYKLIVAGKDITNGNYLSVDNITDNSCDIHLPFTTIAKCYGSQVNWISNTVAEITIQADKYILDLSNVSLVKEGSSFNYLIPVPGSSVHSRVTDKELILDSVTLRSALSSMGLNIQIRINHQDKTVTIQ